MDEDTVDCKKKKKIARYSVRIEQLSDDARWVLIEGWMVCRRHVGELTYSPGELLAQQRLVVRATY